MIKQEFEKNDNIKFEIKEQFIPITQEKYINIELNNKKLSNILAEICEDLENIYEKHTVEDKDNLINTLIAKTEMLIKLLD